MKIEFNIFDIRAIYRLHFPIIAGFLLLVGCSEDDGIMQAPESAINNALAIIPGAVIDSEPETEEGILAWKVEIRTDQGAELEVYTRQDNGALLRIDGESGPFDYNLDPGNSLIQFGQARDIGSDKAPTETLTYWRLRIEDKYNNQWVYSLEYTQTKVFINAADGSVLEIEN